jgi:phenylpropionate dioxygenase-like ring-hydroxylating dioxygenase large terminal subunit
MSQTTLKQRNGTMTTQGPNGYDQNWYALGFSHEIERGQVVGKDFLDGRVVMYRGEDGKARVMSAYCRHLGSDLSVGQVVGNDIRCAFHHWQYGENGRCTKIPVSERIPEKARLFSFPTAEKWGLVWVFNGPEPLFAVPSFVGFAEPQLAFHTTKSADFPVEHWVPLTNSVDFQHLRVLHGLQVDYDPEDIKVTDHGIDYDVHFESPQFGAFDQHIHVSGTNTISLSGKMAGMDALSMFTGTDLPNGYTTGWIVTATSKPSSESEEERHIVEQRLAMMETFFCGLIEEDTPVINTIHFREGILLPADKALAKFLAYVRRYPKAHPLAEFA